MIGYIATLLMLSYLLFVFISDQLNPLLKAKAPLKRRRWRFGKSAAISSLIAGTVALLLLHYLMISERAALTIYLGLGLIFVTPAAVRYKKSALWR